MKTNYLAAFLCLLLAFPAISQNPFGGKPQYDILVRQYPDTFGIFRIELYPTVAPMHCENFDTLAQQGFYDSLAFHRVVANFVIQGGDPNSKTGPPSTWGQGAPWQQQVPAEFSPVPHEREIIGAARGTNINSATSQFYVNLVTNSHLNGAYTAYGRVINGMNVVDSVEAVPVDANDLPLNKVDMFVLYVGVDTTSPTSAPTVTSPSNNATDVLKETEFTWNAITPQDFILYRIQFSKQSDFSTIEHEAHIGKNTTKYSPGDNIEQGYVTYYWRVQTNNGGKFKTSQLRSFTTGIGVPLLTFPAEDATNVYRNTYLDWDDVPSATEYRVTIATVPTFSVPSLVVLDTVVNGSLFLTPALESNRNYYWSVAAINSGAQGSFAEIRKFTTGSLINSLNAQSRSNVHIFPNPVLEALMIGGLSDQEISVQIFDALGNIVLDIQEHRSDERIEVSDIQSGLYFMKIQIGEQVEIRTLIKE